MKHKMSFDLTEQNAPSYSYNCSYYHKKNMADGKPWSAAAPIQLKADGMSYKSKWASLYFSWSI